MTTVTNTKTLDLYDFYSKLEGHNILLSFKGTITSDLLSSILLIMESKLESAEEAPKVRKKVFNVLVESLQNLYYHIEEKPDDTEEMKVQFRNAMFMIGKKDGMYNIMTGNYIELGTVDTIKEKIDMVNGMSRDELKSFYQEILNDGKMSSKGTAGLGMIDIARKSGQQLGYSFVTVEDGRCFFSLNVQVSHE